MKEERNYVYVATVPGYTEYTIYYAIAIPKGFIFSHRQVIPPTVNVHEFIIHIKSDPNGTAPASTYSEDFVIEDPHRTIYPSSDSCGVNQFILNFKKEGQDDRRTIVRAADADVGGG